MELTYLFSDEPTGFHAKIAVVDNGNGTLAFGIDLGASAGRVEGLQALYLKRNSAALEASLATSEVQAEGGSIGPDLQEPAVQVLVEDSGKSNGRAAFANADGFDVRLEFSDIARNKDDMRHLGFTLKADVDLDINSFDLSHIGLQVAEVGNDDCQPAIDDWENEPLRRRMGAAGGFGAGLAGSGECDAENVIDFTRYKRNRALGGGTL